MTGSQLWAKVVCPVCRKKLLPCDEVPIWFHWGREGWAYGIGDPIRWVRDTDGTIASDCKVVKKRWLWMIPYEAWNCGDPSFRDVIALDASQGSLTCHSCGAHADSLAVVIRQGQIDSYRVFESGELEATFGRQEKLYDIITIERDGTYRVRSEWYDTPLTHD